MPRIEVPVSCFQAAASYVQNAGPALQSGGLAYAMAAYGNAAAQAFGLPLWHGPRPVAVAFTIPPEPPP